LNRFEVSLEEICTMRPTFDMDALRAIVVGTDLGSFARAASQLGRSQSAISMQLRKLEEQAGLPLFRRNGRGLVPTEAGEALLVYARRIITLNDEAAVSLGANSDVTSARMGLPQDFFEDVMPEAIVRFSRRHPRVHVEVRAGRNHGLEEDVRAGRLDVALAFFPSGSDGHGTLVASLPMLWLAARKLARPSPNEPVPLVLYDHPCLFRQAALETLERKGLRWRMSLTTPSLPGVWAALHSGYGISVRIARRVPAGIRNVGPDFGLPKLPPIELRLLTASDLSPTPRLAQKSTLSSAKTSLCGSSRSDSSASNLAPPHIRRLAHGTDNDLRPDGLT
jgi:DNA-binding transcriptional LysR family regulator